MCEWRGNRTGVASSLWLLSPPGAKVEKGVLSFGMTKLSCVPSAGSGENDYDRELAYLA